jgi:hypothetical protein
MPLLAHTTVSGLLVSSRGSPESFQRSLLRQCSVFQRLNLVENPVTSPKNRAWLDKHEISTNTSITADWSGSGIASTEEDFLKFSQALQ